jgi:hypothetical protein
LDELSEEKHFNTECLEVIGLWMQETSQLLLWEYYVAQVQSCLFKKQG